MCVCVSMTVCASLCICIVVPLVSFHHCQPFCGLLSASWCMSIWLFVFPFGWHSPKPSVALTRRTADYPPDPVEYGAILTGSAEARSIPGSLRP